MAPSKPAALSLYRRLLRAAWHWQGSAEASAHDSVAQCARFHHLPPPLPPLLLCRRRRPRLSLFLASQQEAEYIRTEARKKFRAGAGLVGEEAAQAVRAGGQWMRAAEEG